MRLTDKTIDAAERFDSENGILALRLHGSWEQMGRQYGMLLAPELNELRDNVMKRITPEVTENSRLFHAGMPFRFQSIVHGAAFGANIPVEDMQAVNAFEFVSATCAQCSSGAAWGNHTIDEYVIFGRNYDWFRSAEMFTPKIVVSVWNPIDGSLPFAMVAWAGLLYLTTGMNSAGVFAELNAEVISGAPFDFANRVFSPVSLMGILNDSTSLHQAEIQLCSLRPMGRHIIGLADSREAAFYAWDLNETKRMTPTENGSPIVATNHFADACGKPVELMSGDAFATCRRYCILERALRRNSGKIDCAVMREIITGELESEAGPALVHDPVVKTYYHVVAQPAGKILWVKDADYPAWVKLRLTELFTH